MFYLKPNLQESVASVLAEARFEGLEPEAMGITAYIDSKKSVARHAIVYRVLVKGASCAPERFVLGNTDVFFDPVLECIWHYPRGR